MTIQKTVLQLAQALSGQWTVPLLLAMAPSRGRFSPLQKALGITPARLSDNLWRLEANGLLVRLSAQERRHPALPEYLLTEEGEQLREAARAMQLTEQRLGLGRLSAQAWNMPLLLALHYGHERFQQIGKALDPVTPRMLSARLESFQQLGTIHKALEAEPRPTFLYHLQATARAPVGQFALDLESLA
ncbi:winged helix-turn-helix transcriptional regulator [Leptospira sp. 96542]|nr:winged helix-turn-helix transcriptional regulator [Leptospira sp. 96542]